MTNAGGLSQLIRGRVLPFDTEAARCYSRLAAIANTKERAFPTPHAYIAAIAASSGYSVATRDVTPCHAVGVTVINPRNTQFRT